MADECDCSNSTVTVALALGIPLLLSIAYHFRVFGGRVGRFRRKLEYAFVIRGSRRQPELPPLNETRRYHLFLSHVWVSPPRLELRL